MEMFKQVEEWKCNLSQQCDFKKAITGCFNITSMEKQKQKKKRLELAKELSEIFESKRYC